MRNATICRFMITGLLLGFLLFTTVSHAASTSCLLSNDKEHVTSEILGTNGKAVRFVANSGSTSKYAVAVYLYGGATSKNITYLEKKKLLDSKESYVEEFTPKKSLVKIHLYGNKKDNPKKGCIATAVVRQK